MIIKIFLQDLKYIICRTKIPKNEHCFKEAWDFWAMFLNGGIYTIIYKKINYIFHTLPVYKFMNYYAQKVFGCHFTNQAKFFILYLTSKELN
jgi:hypothetical protein